MRGFVCVFFCVLILLNTGLCNARLFDRTIKPAAAIPEEYVPFLKNKRVAIIINQTSVVDNESLLDILLKKGVTVKKIFVPEHGFRGREDAGANIDNGVDSATGIPVVSIYGSHKKPKPEDIADIDVMVYDLQDVGVRFFTYISTLEYCMEACAEGHVSFMVLDRPNPNGFYIDGPVLEKGARSFVGMQQVPVVYGMTAGEYAKMLVGERLFNKAADIDLRVIKCANYTHSKKYELPVAPSPNLRSMAAVYAYPSICLFEGTVVSVGRGTDKPFVQYGCPEFKGKYKYSFTPERVVGATNPPYKDKTCYGVLLGCDASDVLQKTGTHLELGWLIDAYNAYPEKSKFFTNYITQLAGTQKLAGQVKHGDTENDIRASWQEDIKKFKTVRKKYLLYSDFE